MRKSVKQQLALRVLSTAALMAMVSSIATAAFADTYDLNKGSVDILAEDGKQYITQWENESKGTYATDDKGEIKKRPDDDIILTTKNKDTGETKTTSNTVTIDAKEDNTANVTLQDVHIETERSWDNSGSAPIEIKGDGDTNLELNGNNTVLSGSSKHAGIEKADVNGTGTLTIKDDLNDNGKEKSGTDATGTLVAGGCYSGAGIGGGAGSLGDVDIEGKVTIQNAQGGIGAAGIGGGAESEPDDDGTGNKTGNKISIKGTEAGSPNITAKGGKASDDGLSGGAAIGSGSVYENDPQDPEEKAPAAITIEGKVTIDATAGGKLDDKDAIAIGDTPLQEQKFAGLPVGAVITRRDSDGKDLTQEGDKPTEPEKPEKPDPEKPEPEKPEPENPNPNPEQPSEPSGAVSTSAPAEELTASDAEYLVTVEGLYVTNALEKQITHTCTQNVQGKVLTIRVNSIVATAHLTMETLRTLKAQGVETIRFCTLLYRPTSVSIDALLNLGVDEADILWTHNGIQARLTVGGTDSSSLLQ